MHVRSFSYIKCMSDKIIGSLEDRDLNHTYALREEHLTNKVKNVSEYNQENIQKLRFEN